MNIAFDPTPLHATHALFEIPGVIADLGYEWIQHPVDPDFLPWFQLATIKDAVAVAKAGRR